MKKLLCIALLSFVLLQSFGQSGRKISLYLSGQFTGTLHDRTLKNNPSSLGLGVQLYQHNRSKFKPVIDITGAAFMAHYNILYVDVNERPLDGVDAMVNVFGGVSYHPARRIYFSLAGGPSFINGETLFGVQPAVGWHFSKTQKVTGRISYINIFNRLESQDFGSIGFSLGVRLY